MTIRGRARAPWYAAATRRLGLLRVGLPTLVVCLVAVGPGAAAGAKRVVPSQAAAFVATMTRAARDAFDPPPGGHGPQHPGDRRGDMR